MRCSFFQGTSTCSGMWSPWAAVWKSASPWSFPWAAGESLLCILEHLLPLFLRPWRLQGCSSHIILLLSSGCCCSLYPFLNMLSQRCHQHHWWVHLCLVVGPSWNCLKLAQSDMGTASGVFSQKPPCHQNLVTWTQYNLGGETGSCPLWPCLWPSLNPTPWGKGMNTKQEVKEPFKSRFVQEELNTDIKYIYTSENCNSSHSIRNKNKSNLFLWKNLIDLWRTI